MTGLRRMGQTETPLSSTSSASSSSALGAKASRPASAHICAAYQQRALSSACFLFFFLRCRHSRDVSEQRGQWSHEQDGRGAGWGKRISARRSFVLLCEACFGCCGRGTVFACFRLLVCSIRSFWLFRGSSQSRGPWIQSVPTHCTLSTSCQQLPVTALPFFCKWTFIFFYQL